MNGITKVNGKRNGKAHSLFENREPSPVVGKAGSVQSRIDSFNRWRSQFNPLRGITVESAIRLLENYRRGWFADLQWAYSYVEETDQDTFALVERRTSAICEMDWNIKITPEDKRIDSFDEKLAEDQSAALREGYDRIDNLYDAVEALEMASFRGFAFVEKQSLKGMGVDHLEIVDQWNMVRDGYYGEWKYNPSAMQQSFDSIATPPIPLDQFICRDLRRHIDRVALIKFLRTSLGEKDWVAFIEIYGIPSGVVIGPQNPASGKEQDFLDAAKNISEGSPGYLPFGSDYKPNDQPRGINPFSEYLRYFSEKLVLVGTGGLLTMLAESGSGTLAGSVHAEAFDQIARAEARKIGIAFNKSLDAQILEEAFPGKPRFAYWELCFNDETSTKDVVDNALKLFQAGYQIEVGELSEKTGYTLTMKPPVLPVNQQDQNQNNDPSDPLANRSSQFQIPAASFRELLQARAEHLMPLLNRINALEKINDPAAYVAALEDLQRDFKRLQTKVRKDPTLAKALEIALSEAVAEGVAKQVAELEAAKRNGK